MAVEVDAAVQGSVRQTTSIGDGVFQTSHVHQGQRSDSAAHPEAVWNYMAKSANLESEGEKIKVHFHVIDVVGPIISGASLNDRTNSVAFNILPPHEKGVRRLGLMRKIRLCVLLALVLASQVAGIGGMIAPVPCQVQQPKKRRPCRSRLGRHV